MAELRLETEASAANLYIGVPRAPKLAPDQRLPQPVRRLARRREVGRVPNGFCSTPGQRLVAT